MSGIVSWITSAITGGPAAPTSALTSTTPVDPKTMSKGVKVKVKIYPYIFDPTLYSDIYVEPEYYSSTEYFDPINQVDALLEVVKGLSLKAEDFKPIEYEHSYHTNVPLPNTIDSTYLNAFMTGNYKI